jgi:hypothetical protein
VAAVAGRYELEKAQEVTGVKHAAKSTPLFSRSGGFPESFKDLQRFRNP